MLRPNQTALTAVALLVCSLVASCGLLGVSPADLDALGAEVAASQETAVELLARIEAVAADPALDPAQRQAELAALTARVHAELLEPVDALALVVSDAVAVARSNADAIAAGAAGTLSGLASGNPVALVSGLAALLAALGLGGRAVKRQAVAQVHSERDTARAARAQAQRETIATALAPAPGGTPASAGVLPQSNTSPLPTTLPPETLSALLSLMR